LQFYSCKKTSQLSGKSWTNKRDFPFLFRKQCQIYQDNGEWNSRFTESIHPEWPPETNLFVFKDFPSSCPDPGASLTTHSVLILR